MCLDIHSKGFQQFYAPMPIKIKISLQKEKHIWLPKKYLISKKFNTYKIYCILTSSSGYIFVLGRNMTLSMILQRYLWSHQIWNQSDKHLSAFSTNRYVHLEISIHTIEGLRLLFSYSSNKFKFLLLPRTFIFFACARFTYRIRNLKI